MAKRWQTPKEDPDSITIAKPEGEAGGLTAVVSSMKMVNRETSLPAGMASLMKMNKEGGFDCPGCAWPDPDSDRHMAEFCENGAKAFAEEATDALCDAATFQRLSVDELASHSDFALGRLGRLAEPMLKAKGASHYEPISWDDAFARITATIKDLDDAHEAVFYTSGRTSNEAAYLYQLFARHLGTNNLPDCSNMCHESSGTGLGEAIGIGKGTVTIEDIEAADLIMLFGHNPGTNHPRMLGTLQTAKKNGATIVVVNPIQEAGSTAFRHPQKPLDLIKATTLGDHHLPVNINGDVALVKGILKGVVEKHPAAINHDFIDAYTEGFEALLADIEATPWDEITTSSGINKEMIMDQARLFASSKRLVICWCMGITQHVNGVANVQMLANLLLVGGHFGRLGAGACPVRGHSNVQGDRTMGIYEKPPAAFIDAIRDRYDIVAPYEPGYSVVDALPAMRDGKVRFFMAMGGNLLSASPDTKFTAEAMARPELSVYVATKLNRSHLVSDEAVLLLPCLGRTEADVKPSGMQIVSMENSMGIIHHSKGVRRPCSKKLRSEPDIVAELGKRLFPETPLWDEALISYDAIRDEIAAVVPFCENYNDRVRQPAGDYLYNPVRDDLKFPTPSYKAQFVCHPIPDNSLAEGVYMMMTIRTHDQFNTTIYGLDDRYRGITGGRRVILMNSGDMEREGFREKQPITITSHFNGVERVAEDFLAVPYPIPEGAVATYFPEANVLVPIDQFAERSHTPASKSVRVTLAASGGSRGSAPQA